MRLVLDARSASLGALIDYAGMFPPTSLSVSDAIATYRRHRASSRGWMIGRFLAPASRLTDVAASLTSSTPGGEAPWQVGVIFDLPPGEAAMEAQAFHAEMQPAVVIGAAEARIEERDPDEIGRLIDTLASVQPEIVVFLEVDRERHIGGQVAAVTAALGERAATGGVKLRCGGATPDMFPSPDEAAAFVQSATEAHVPFKLTAGLHRPVRHFDDALGVWRHGFVNLLVATAAAVDGMNRNTVVSIIAEADPDAFSLGPAFATWRDLRVPGPTLRRIRATGLVSFGSCDVDEPIATLHALGMVGDGS